MARLTVDRLRKRFGQIEALRAATFRVEPEEVLGLLGPNGAGKSALLACLADLLLADGGEVRGEDGQVIDPPSRRDALVYLPDAIRPWPDQTTDFAAGGGRGFSRIGCGSRMQGNRSTRRSS